MLQPHALAQPAHNVAQRGRVVVALQQGLHRRKGRVGIHEAEPQQLLRGEASGAPGRRCGAPLFKHGAEGRALVHHRLARPRRVFHQQQLLQDAPLLGGAGAEGLRGEPDGGPRLGVALCGVRGEEEGAKGGLCSLLQRLLCVPHQPAPHSRVAVEVEVRWGRRAAQGEEHKDEKSGRGGRHGGGLGGCGNNVSVHGRRGRPFRAAKMRV